MTIGILAVSAAIILAVLFALAFIAQGAQSGMPRF